MVTRTWGTHFTSEDSAIENEKNELVWDLAASDSVLSALQASRTVRRDWQCLNQSRYWKLRVVVHACSSRMLETEAGGKQI